MKRIIPFVILLITSLQALAGEGVSTQTIRQTKSLTFVENKGQVTDQYYKSRNDIDFKLEAAGGLNIFIGNGTIHYQFSKRVAVTEKIITELKPSAIDRENFDRNTYDMYRMDVELLGANKYAEIEREGKQGYYENYYTVGTGENGVTVHSFIKVTYREIYPHIDWVLYIKSGQLKHEFVVRQGGKVSDIRLKYGGATELKINENGSLTAKTPHGEIREEKPASFTTSNVAVNSSYKLDGDILTYDIAAHHGVLTIDPKLEWGTYFGGSSYEESRHLTIDTTEYLYTSGNIESAGMATTGTHQVFLGGSKDVFITKFSTMGTPLWTTYFGGSNLESTGNIAINNSGIFLAGFTSSNSGIATNDAYQKNNNGKWDVFLAKFNDSGLRSWATYYGGTEDDISAVISFDAAGMIYLVGGTESNDHIATAGAHQPAHGGGTFSNDDGFIVKFDEQGVRKWGTYYGGSGIDIVYDIGIDDSFNFYIVGVTNSSDGIGTTGAHQTSLSTGSSNVQDIFLARFDSSGKRLWGTYYGGTEMDHVGSILVGDSGNVYMTGHTRSSNGNSIATPGSYQPGYTGAAVGNGDGFLVKFTPEGIRKWGTYFGGNGNDNPICLANDTFGNIYIAGGTGSADNIATAGAFQSVISGKEDGFIAKFNNNGIPEWGTYYGGNAYDLIFDIVTDSLNNLYIVGRTESINGIATNGGYVNTFQGSNDCFFAKLCQSAPVLQPITGPDSVYVGNVINLVNNYAGGTWFSSKRYVTTNMNGDITGSTPGIDTVIYAINHACGNDTVYHTIKVLLSPVTQGIRIYPNPTKSLVTITAANTIKKIEVTNLLGQKLLSKEGNSKTITIDLEGLAPGVYIIKVNDSYVARIVKE